MATFLPHCLHIHKTTMDSHYNLTCVHCHAVLKKLTEFLSHPQSEYWPLPGNPYENCLALPLSKEQLVAVLQPPLQSCITFHSY